MKTHYPRKRDVQGYRAAFYQEERRRVLNERFEALLRAAASSVAARGPFGARIMGDSLHNRRTGEAQRWYRNPDGSITYEVDGR